MVPLERPPQAPQQERGSGLESTANFEGNWSEALFNRMHDRTIRAQLVDLLYREQQALADYYRTHEFTLDFVRDNGDRVLVDQQGHQVLETEKNSFIPKSKEIIEAELDERLKEEMVLTPIEFSEAPPTTESMGVFARNPYTNEPLTIGQKSLAEAHEKGHALRPYNAISNIGDFFDKHFAPGFDISKVEFSDEDIEALHRIQEMDHALSEDVERQEKQTREELVKKYLDYIFSGNEIAERMAQLKNYFGMKSSEQFTHEHLQYARDHYLRDVGLNNGMSQFFQAITRETETEFLRLINSSGI